MTKAELIERVAGKTAVTQKQTRRTIDAAFREILNAVQKGECFKFSGFGTFEMKERAPRAIKNPTTGNVVHVPARNILAFHASKKIPR